MGISSTEMRIASTKVSTKRNGESNKKNACLCQFVPAKNMLTNRDGEFNQHKMQALVCIYHIVGHSVETLEYINCYIHAAIKHFGHDHKRSK